MLFAFVFLLIFGSSIIGVDFKGRELTFQHSQWFRGVVALLVLAHHMKPDLGACSVFHSCSGKYCVAAFFFMSGYGLMLQLDKAREKMFLDYGERRFPKLLIPYATAWVLAVWVLKGGMPDWETIGNHWLTGESYLPFAYYVEELCLLYAVFWLCFRFFRQSVGLVLLFGATIAAMLLLRAFHWNNHWWVSSVSFPLGALMAYVVRRKISMWFPVCGVCCLFLLLLGAMKCGCLDRVTFHAFAVEPVFSVLLVLVIPRLRLRSQKLNGMMFLGGISYEFYILSGSVLYWCRHVDYPWYPCLVIPLLAVVAVVFHYINGRIIRCARQLTERES